MPSPEITESSRFFDIFSLQIYQTIFFLLASATVGESFEKDFSTLMELVKETQFTWSTTAVISC